MTARRNPIAAGIAGLFALSAPPVCCANILYVTSCLDDGSLYTLRNSVLSAATGDTVDLTLLNAASPGCATATPPGTININAGGQIVPPSGIDLSIVGPTNYTITISSMPASPAGARTRIFSRSAGGGTLRISNLTLAHAGDVTTGALAGGGCVNADTSVLYLQSVTMTDCLAQSASLVFGGAVRAGTLHVLHSSITGSSVSGAALYGGAIACGNCQVSYSTISGNSAVTNAIGGNGSGGAIYSGGSADIENSTISGNSSLSSGALRCAGSCKVINSTISGNFATGGAVAGIYAGGGSTFIYNSTIAFNTAISAASGRAPGLAILNGGSAKLYSTIVSDNTYGAGTHFDFSIQAGITLSAGNDMVPFPPAGGMPAGSNSLPGVCPLLLPLSNTGGPTRTHALPSHSPAIDAGSNVSAADPAYDQRGPPFLRASGAAPDIGAYEVDTGEVVFNAGFERCP